MIATVTNVSGHAINYPDVVSAGSGPSGIYATGGNTRYPLPYPFAHIGSLANGVGKALPMHSRDWRYRVVPAIPQEPSKEWQQLVQAGVVTFAAATETADRDEEGEFFHAI